MSHTINSPSKSKKEASHSHHHQHGGKASASSANNNQCNSTTSKRGDKRCSASSLASAGISSGGPVLSFTSGPISASMRALKSQAEGHFKRLVLMAEGNEEQLSALVSFLECATRLVDSSQPKLHACLLCSHRADNQSLADAHLADHQKGRRFCCAFSGCAYAADERAQVVEHVKRKHFTDEYDTRVALANNYVHEMGRAAD